MDWDLNLGSNLATEASQQEDTLTLPLLNTPVWIVCGSHRCPVAPWPDRHPLKIPAWPEYWGRVYDNLKQWRHRAEHGGRRPSGFRYGRHGHHGHHADLPFTNRIQHHLKSSKLSEGKLLRLRLSLRADGSMHCNEVTEQTVLLTPNWGAIFAPYRAVLGGLATLAAWAV